ncbi:MAG: serine--tRNA ligase [Proteobacteria bacterium]|nr:serine--tRNA ligase [Pseudomonadota bacterium]
MIDSKLLRQDFAGVKELLKTRGLPEQFDSWPALDEKKRSLLKEVEDIRANKNKLGPEIAKAKKEGRDVSSLTNELKLTGEREKEIDETLLKLDAEILYLEQLIPNIPHSTVPVGLNENDNRVEKYWGEKPKFNFQPKAHWDVTEALGIVDFERATKISGARFAIMRAEGARLERALINFMLDSHRKKGYTEIIPPLLVRRETMVGSGQLPKFEDQAFKTEGFDPQFYLIPTSEVPMCNLHGGEILEASQLPFYYTSYTPCFRAEAGSHGRDVRGLIRQHQFNKVELVKITAADTSFEEHEKLTLDAEAILEALNLHYRRITLCTGDMGMGSAKTYDLEVWLPGLDTYREISSCSNMTDFQSRRTATRYRQEPGAKPQFVHMLNGSGLAVGRTLVAIVENYQQADGSVVIPEVLRPYFGGDIIKL